MKKIYFLFLITAFGFCAFTNSAQAKTCHSHSHYHNGVRHKHKHCHGRHKSHHGDYNDHYKYKKHYKHHKPYRGPKKLWVNLSVKADHLHKKQVMTSGELYNRYEMIGAHYNLPIGTKVLVTNLRNQKSVVVRIADHVPSNSRENRRMFKISRRAAKKLGIRQNFPIRAKIEVLEN